MSTQPLQRTPEWFEHRKGRITASRVGAILGISIFNTREDVMRQMVREYHGAESEFLGNIVTQYGCDHEVDAIAAYEAESGNLVKPAPLVVHPEYDWLAASPDGYVGPDGLVEAKAPYRAQYTDASEEYQQQMQVQMACTGRQFCDFAIWRDGEPVTIKRYHFDVDKFAETLRVLELFFKEFRAIVESSDLSAPYLSDRPAEAVGAAPSALPALHIELSGQVKASNLEVFKSTALQVLGSINTELESDQDFADAEQTVKWAKSVEDKLDAAKDHALSQTADIEALFRAIDEIREEARTKRLHLDKLVKERKKALKLEIAHAAKADIDAHIETINASLDGVRLPPVPFSIGDAMKGKKKLDSLRDAAKTEAARVKAEASRLAEHIRANLKRIQDAGHPELFSDRQTLVEWNADGLTALIKDRVRGAEEAAQAKAEAERERIRQEEAAKVERQAEEAAQTKQAKQTQQPDTDVTSIEAAKPSGDRRPSADYDSRTRRTRPTGEAIIRTLMDAYAEDRGTVEAWIFGLAAELSEAS